MSQDDTRVRNRRQRIDNILDEAHTGRKKKKKKGFKKGSKKGSRRKKGPLFE